jgi:hypothetical protein
MSEGRFWYQLPEADQVGVWNARLGAAREVYKRVEGRTTTLQNSIAHERNDGIRARELDTIKEPELNLMSRTTLGFKAGLFTNRPKVTNPRTGDIDEETATFEETLVEAAMRRGNCMRAWERASGHMMTTGCGIVFTGFDSEMQTAGRLLAMGASLSAFVAAVAQGEAAPKPLPGMDLVKLEQIAAKAVGDEVEGRTMEEVQRDRLIALRFKIAEMLEAQDGKPDHDRKRRRRIWYKTLQWGRDIWWDQTVYDFEDKDWFVRKIALPMDHAQALCGPAEEGYLLKNAVKNRLKAQAFKDSDGHVTVDVDGMHEKDIPASENQECVLYELWIRSRNERRYFQDGGTEWLENNSEYPFVDEMGESWMPGYFPIAFCAPIEIDKPRPEYSGGLPPLWYGLDHQEEMNKTRTAWYRGCKRSGRVFDIRPGLSDDEKTALEEGDDGLLIEREEGAKNPRPSVDPIDLGQAPIDLLKASSTLLYDFAASVGVSMPALTGQPVADTLGQEQIAVEAVGVTTRYLADKVEGAVARTAEQTRALLRHAFSPKRSRSTCPSGTRSPSSIPRPESRRSRRSFSGGSRAPSWAMTSR